MRIQCYREHIQRLNRAQARKLALHACHKLNLPRYLCECAFGEAHDTLHRFGAGGTIMVIGVSIAKFGPHLMPWTGIDFFTDCAGYLVHAAGTIPFVDALIRRAREEVKEG